MDPSMKRTLQCHRANWVWVLLGLKRSMMTHLSTKRIRLIFLKMILIMKLNLLLFVEEIIVQRLFRISVWLYKLKTLMHLKVMVFHMLLGSANQQLQWRIRLYIVPNLKTVDVLLKINMLFLRYNKKYNSFGSLMIN